MTAALIAVAIYLLPGVAVVGWNARRAIKLHGHHGLRVVVIAFGMALLTWPMMFVLPRKGR